MEDTTRQDAGEHLTAFRSRETIRLVVSTTLALVVWLTVIAAVGSKVRQARDDLEIARRDHTLLQQQIAQLQRQVAPLTDPLQKIVKPKLFVQQVGRQKDDNGRQLYDVIFFVTLPESRRSEILSVRYFVDYPERRNRITESALADTGFAVSHRATGCFPRVKITVTPQKNALFDIDWNECEAWASLRAAGGIKVAE